MYLNKMGLMDFENKSQMKGYKRHQTKKMQNKQTNKQIQVIFKSDVKMIKKIMRRSCHQVILC